MTLFQPQTTGGQDITGQILSSSHKATDMPEVCNPDLNYVEDDCDVNLQYEWKCSECLGEEYAIAEYRDGVPANKLYRRVVNGFDALCWLDDAGDQHCIFPTT